MHNEQQGSLRAIVLDDETVSRAGLIAILGAESSIVISAAVATQAEAIKAASQYRAEVLVASAEYWRDGPGFDALAEFVASVQVPVVLVAGSLNAQIVRQARSAGAAGLIAKRASAPAIRGAVHAAAEGASVFPRVPKGSLAKPPSGREQQIIGRVADGRTNDEIAGALGLSVRTVASHLRRCFIRYEVSSRTELAMLAVRERWVVDGASPLGFRGTGAA